MEQDPRATAFLRLLKIMDELREQCPWDRKQTMETLRPLTIEETYELGDAILRNDMDEVRNELGDLILHMVFYARIANEKDAFDITEVLNGICEKLIVRHPHIYGDVQVKDEEEVKANWEKIKLAEKAKAGTEKSVLEGVPRGLPSLVKAIRIQDKARGVGFDWENKEQVWEKVNEELAELKQEGVTILFISHKLGEVLEIADEITVIRDGRTIDTLPAAGLSQGDIATMMVGREVLLRIEHTPASPGEEGLAVGVRLLRATTGDRDGRRGDGQDRGVERRAPLEQGPGHDPRDGRIPALATRYVGSLRQPERLGLLEIQPIRPVHDRGELASGFAVVATFSDPLIGREALL